MVDGINSAIKPTAVTVGATATAIPATARKGRKSILVKNVGDASVYFGDDTVTTANGYPVAANGILELDLGENVVLYGIVATGTQEVRILEGV